MKDRNKLGQFVKGHKSGALGKTWKLSKEANRRNSERAKLRTGTKAANWKGGKPKCLDCGKQLSNYGIKRCVACAKLGKNNPAWKGGIMLINKRIRHLKKYKKWQKEVLKRDYWTCQNCKRHGCFLETHHIKSLAVIVKENNIKTIYQAINNSKLWNIDNGQSLCTNCHALTNNYRGRSNKKK